MVKKSKKINAAQKPAENFQKTGPKGKSLNLSFAGLVILAVISLAVIITFAAAVSGVNNKPEVVKHFACSDYCPGPGEQYTIDVYKNVTDPRECKELGGEIYTYYGFEEYQVCRVVDN